jgi:hypothetical protein
MARTRAANTPKKNAAKTKAITATTKASTSKTGRSAPTPPSIRGEKRVKETDASVPVGPARRRRGTHDGPTVAAAIDRRKQFSGTDEPADPKGGSSARRPAGGNAGRRAVGLPHST